MEKKRRMTEEERKRFHKIWRMSQVDPDYLRMLIRTEEVENEYVKQLALMPSDVRCLMQEYAAQCEILHWRMLQIACEQMRFPEEL